jgi:hypothetical protein
MGGHEDVGGAEHRYYFGEFMFMESAVMGAGLTTTR